ncbi:PREDICTED: protein PHLOEM PROTEIN 2-LIKE A8-like isoform X1 [Tarenaya hassleriana]|uniref:protein PHLOEM PROTEIN 2-LIKE A8-like isoform X1 n=1 Tax=Tarenaya hassleriana TaxID=28532 RepID=UPI00053C4AAF|nr:PREDICTED: protein PHLOEM PROTEIN 2-LIKE A8-like isoform X1 [Tarenaya hassleriana]
MGAFSRHLAPPPPQQQQHEVFISYRGEELRYGFLSHLVDAFRRRRIRFFVDKGARRGEDLRNLFVRIQESRIALAVFSTRYPESEWCLDELVKIDECVKMGNLRVIPIFFKVKPDDVRRQEGDFGENFWKLAKNSRGEQIMRWKDALESVSDKMGLAFDGKREPVFVKSKGTVIWLFSLVWQLRVRIYQGNRYGDRESTNCDPIRAKRISFLQSYPKEKEKCPLCLVSVSSLAKNKIQEILVTICIPWIPMIIVSLPTRCVCC